jgi:hypothetical protein
MLIGTGVRTITWLYINVYVMALYIEKSGLQNIKASNEWKVIPPPILGSRIQDNLERPQSFSASDFLENDETVHNLLNTKEEMSIRIGKLHMTAPILNTLNKPL